MPASWVSISYDRLNLVFNDSSDLDIIYIVIFLVSLE